MRKRSATAPATGGNVGVWFDVLGHPVLALQDRMTATLTEVPGVRVVDPGASVTALVAGCFTGGIGLIGRPLSDTLSEPYRAPRVPGFARVKAPALDAGALGCSLSASRPSGFAWYGADAPATEAASQMVETFAAAGVPSRARISPVDPPGATLLDSRATDVEGAA